MTRDRIRDPRLPAPSRLCPPSRTKYYQKVLQQRRLVRTMTTREVIPGVSGTRLDCAAIFRYLFVTAAR